MSEPAGNPRARVDWLFMALLAAQVGLFWSVRYIPSQDGTSHLANAHVLLNYHAADGAMYRQYYAINKTLEPNLLSHVLLVALMTIVPALVAQKILISGYVIALALGARYAIRSVSPRNDFLAVLIFPLAGNLMLQKGFYNFSYSLAVYLWFVGYWLRGKRSPWCVFGLSLLLYLCHPVSLILAVATIAMMALADGPSTLRKRLTPWLALLPAAALLAYFFIVQSHGGGPISGGIEPALGGWKSLHDRLKILLTLEVLYSFRMAEAWVAIAYASLMGIVAIAAVGLKDPRMAIRGLSREAIARVAALVVVAIACVAAPEQSAGGSWIPHRLSLYPWLILLLILAGGNYASTTRIGIRFLAAVLALGMIASHALAYRSTQKYLDEYVAAASHIDRGSTIVSAISDRGAFKKLSPRVRCFLTATGYLDERRDLVDLYNYEAVMGYFPLVYRAELNPGPYFDDSKDDVAGYVAATHGRVDYILIWQPSAKYPPAALAMLQPVLAADYQLVYTSPSQYLLLYHHR